MWRIAYRWPYSGVRARGSKQPVHQAESRAKLRSWRQNSWEVNAPSLCVIRSRTLPFKTGIVSFVPFHRPGRSFFGWFFACQLHPSVIFPPFPREESCYGNCSRFLLSLVSLYLSPLPSALELSLRAQRRAHRRVTRHVAFQVVPSSQTSQLPMIGACLDYGWNGQQSVCEIGGQGGGWSV